MSWESFILRVAEFRQRHWVGLSVFLSRVSCCLSDVQEPCNISCVIVIADRLLFCVSHTGGLRNSHQISLCIPEELNAGIKFTLPSGCNSFQTSTRRVRPALHPKVVTLLLLNSSLDCSLTTLKASCRLTLCSRELCPQCHLTLQRLFFTILQHKYLLSF